MKEAAAGEDEKKWTCPLCGRKYKWPAVHAKKHVRDLAQRGLVEIVGYGRPYLGAAFKYQGKIYFSARDLIEDIGGREEPAVYNRLLDAVTEILSKHKGTEAYVSEAEFHKLGVVPTITQLRCLGKIVVGDRVWRFACVKRRRNRKCTFRVFYVFRRVNGNPPSAILSSIKNKV